MKDCLSIASNFQCLRSLSVLLWRKGGAMPPKFGTSGLRGLVTELTSDCVRRHVQAFLACCPDGVGLMIGHDLRDSSPAIAQDVSAAARAMGTAVTHCGALPTPALALAAGQVGAAAVMITGSHIPADRNGLKFYTPQGEITKADEVAILAGLDEEWDAVEGPAPVTNTTAHNLYLDRYKTAFADGLAGLTIGLYAQSAVGRDHIAHLFKSLGAEVIELGRSDVFVPVDTEAVSPETRARLIEWAKTHKIDAIVSTDADGDRPLLADQAGVIVPGDVLGQITALAVGADLVVTPVSSNTSIEAAGIVTRVLRTKIGSPFVIAAMEDAGGKVVGYEANGGFLLGFDVQGPTGPLPALMTRDAMLPLIATLFASRDGGVSALVAAQQTRFTAADRLQDTPTDLSQALIATLRHDADSRAAFLADMQLAEKGVDLTDGLRITMVDDTIVHLRPSGNAPELRVYVEADIPERAADLLELAKASVAEKIFGKI